MIPFKHTKCVSYQHNVKNYLSAFQFQLFIDYTNTCLHFVFQMKLLSIEEDVGF